jgi:cytochrome c biogenesis protein CcdA
VIHLFDSLFAAFIAFTPATIAGTLAVTANCVWPLLGSRRRILAVQVLSSVLFGLHYTLLGAHTATAMCIAGALQGVAATTLRNRWARNGVFGATIAMGLAITAATWSGLPSALAQSGQLLSAMGRLQRHEQAIRLFFLGSEA